MIFHRNITPCTNIGHICIIMGMENCFDIDSTGENGLQVLKGEFNLQITGENDFFTVIITKLQYMSYVYQGLKTE